MIKLRSQLKLLFLVVFFFITCQGASAESRPRIQDWKIMIGVLERGKWNAITDVDGVKVGQVTLVIGNNIRTGVTVIIPHQGNVFQEKVPAAIYVANGFGKLAGYTQVEELGNLETPIALTNTLSVPVAVAALIDYTLTQPGNEEVRSVNPVVGETNDGYLNDIRGQVVKKKDVLKAITLAVSGPVEEGCVGAGTGTVCFGFKGGIGTASRKLPEKLGGYTVGVLVQTNFGGILQIQGCPVGKLLNRYYLQDKLTPDGSCLIVVATDAPLDGKNLKRLAKRAILGLARVGGICANGSGDYVIAFSTARSMRIPHQSESGLLDQKILHHDHLTPLFLGVIEATEEAILNSLFKATKMEGVDHHQIEALPLEKIKSILEQYQIIIKEEGEKNG